MKKISIYLAGNVRKTKGEEDDSWRNKFKEKLTERLKDIDVRFIDPTNRPDSIKDSYSIFARDVYLTSTCDFILVEASNKTGIGVGVEMFIAKTNGIPVVSVVPKGSYYRSTDHRLSEVLSKEQIDNWIHPFILGLSDVIVENLDEATKWIKEHLNEKKKIKDISVIKEAIEYYKKTHYDKDGHARNAFE
jgi:hypothetical protein